MPKETTTQVENKGMSQRSEDLLHVYKALTLDIPLAGVRWAFGSANDKESTITLWKGYDAGVRLATSAVDSLYRSQSLSEIVGNTVNQMLRLQQLSNAASRLFVTGLLPPLALPTSPAVQPVAAQAHARVSDTTLLRTQKTARRSQKRRTRTQKPTQTPAYLLPQQKDFQAAA